MASIGSPKVIAGWAVEERMARRLINIPAEYAIIGIKFYSGCVAIGHHANILTLSHSISLIRVVRSNGAELKSLSGLEIRCVLVHIHAPITVHLAPITLTLMQSVFYEHKYHTSIV